MGFASDTGRVMLLSATKSDLEFQIQSLQQSDTQISTMLMNALPLGAAGGGAGGGDPNSPQMLQYLSLEAKFNPVSTQLEMRIQQLQAQAQATQTEIDSVNKVINSDVKDFGLLGNKSNG